MAILNPWRIVGWGTVAFLLLLPAVAMQFTDEVAWTGFDFAFAAAIFLSVGVPFEFAVRKSTSPAYRVACGLALLGTRRALCGVRGERTIAASVDCGRAVASNLRRSLVPGRNLGA